MNTYVVQYLLNLVSFGKSFLYSNVSTRSLLFTNIPFIVIDILNIIGDKEIEDYFGIFKYLQYHQICRKNSVILK